MSPSSASPQPILDKPVLLVGLGGKLWRAWDELLAARGVQRRSPDLNQLDLTRPETIEKWVRPDLGLVVNAAAFTDVEAGESQSDLAMAINGTGVGDLARHCANTGVTLIHYSSDYVFSGEKRVPYLTTDEPHPISAYGRSKAMGEKLLKESGCRHLMVRMSGLYSPWGRSFVSRVIDLASSQKVIRVVNDRTIRPTSAQHVTRATLELSTRGHTGTWHITDGGQSTWFEFASWIVKCVGSDCVVEPCSSNEFPQKAARPIYSVLDLCETEKVLGPMPQWRDNVADVIREKLAADKRR